MIFATLHCIKGSTISIIVNVLEKNVGSFLEMSTIASFIEDWIRVNDRYLGRITLEDLNLLSRAGFTDSHFSNLILNGASVIEIDRKIKITY